MQAVTRFFYILFVYTMLTLDEFINENHDVLRDLWREELVDQWYPQHVIDNTDDGRDEFCRREYETRNNDNELIPSPTVEKEMELEALFELEKSKQLRIEWNRRLIDKNWSDNPMYI